MIITTEVVIDKLEILSPTLAISGQSENGISWQQNINLEPLHIYAQGRTIDNKPPGSDLNYHPLREQPFAEATEIARIPLTPTLEVNILDSQLDDQDAMWYEIEAMITEQIERGWIWASRVEVAPDTEKFLQQMASEKRCVANSKATLSTITPTLVTLGDVVTITLFLDNPCSTDLQNFTFNPAGNFLVGLDADNLTKSFQKATKNLVIAPNNEKKIIINTKVMTNQPQVLSPTLAIVGQLSGGTSWQQNVTFEPLQLYLEGITIAGDLYGQNTNYHPLRDAPSGEQILSLEPNVVVKILSEKLDTEGNRWYLIQTLYGKSQQLVQGWLNSERVEIK